MILALLQARVSSTRLPGKVLRPLRGVPMVLRQVERLRACRRIGRLVLVTSTDASDDRLAALCGDAGLDCFRGSLDDVLDRFYQAALALAPEYVVRLTADCPLADPALIDEVIDACVGGGYDYYSNALEPTYPDGLDVEVFRHRCLCEAWREARLPSEREHVTPFIHARPQRYRLGNHRSPVDRSRLRWTVDEAADLAFVEAVYDALYRPGRLFTTAEVLAWLDAHPALAALNSGISRNEGLEASRARDAAQTPHREPVR